MLGPLSAILGNRMKSVGIPTGCPPGLGQEDCPELPCSTIGLCRRYRLAFLALGPYVPVVGTLLTYLSYLTVPSHGGFPSIVVGLLLTIGFWLLAAIVNASFVSPGTANPGSYSEFRSRYDHVCALAAHPEANVPAALEEVKRYAKNMRQELCIQDLRWISRTGYANIWRILHRAEEALIEVIPEALVVEWGKHDVDRLDGSTIGNRQALQDVLKKTLGQSPPDRHVVRTVRQTIDEFRDDSWTAIVQVRNRLITAVALTAVIVYVLVIYAILRRAPPGPMWATGAFFLVAALIGCFTVMSSLVQSDDVVDDYSLAVARLLARPLFSGLAGVGGVILVAMLSPVVTTTVSGSQSIQVATATPVVSRTPTSRPSANASGNPGGSSSSSPATNAVQTPSLTEILDVERHPFSLILAAIFGFTPALLLDRLSAQANRYTTNLASSESGSRSSGS